MARKFVKLNVPGGGTIQVDPDRVTGIGDIPDRPGDPKFLLYGISGEPIRVMSAQSREAVAASLGIELEPAPMQKKPAGHASVSAKADDGKDRIGATRISNPFTAESKPESGPLLEESVAAAGEKYDL